MKIGLSKRSRDNMATLHKHLVQLINKVAENAPNDFIIIEGFRNKDDQDIAYLTKKSKVKWPNSKHNQWPSEAFDFVPLIDGKVSWNEKDFLALGKCFVDTAKDLGFEVTWGGDFKGDGDKTKTDAWDKPHIELKRKK